jgi:hypothetical protein
VVDAGYAGDVEVEIFNAEIWASPPAEVVRRTVEAFARTVSPYLPRAVGQ